MYLAANQAVLINFYDDGRNVDQAIRGPRDEWLSSRRMRNISLCGHGNLNSYRGALPFDFVPGLLWGSQDLLPAREIKSL